MYTYNYDFLQIILEDDFTLAYNNYTNAMSTLYDNHIKQH